MGRQYRYVKDCRMVKAGTYIVTGANSGLGLSVTKHLLECGAYVIMACRNLFKAHEAKKAIISRYPDAKLIILEYDQADFQSIDRFVDQVVLKYSDFSGIVFNAGIFHPQKGLLTKDGFPLTVGTNYLGAFYLLKKLQDNNLWKQEINRRLVFVGSLSWRRIKSSYIKALLTGKSASAIKAYGISKTMVGSLAYQLAKHESAILYLPSHVKVLLMHPGISSTNIVSSHQSAYPKWFSTIAKLAMKLFLQSAAKASLGILKLLSDEQVSEKKLVVPRGLFHIWGSPKTINYPKNLRFIGETLIDISFKAINNQGN